MSLVIDIYTPNHTSGLNHDADVITSAIKSAFKNKVIVRKIFVPFDCYHSGKIPESFANSIGKLGDLAISIERAYSADFLQLYKARAFYTNPEWFTDKDQAVCESNDVSILHKSKHYYSSLSEQLPNNKHYYTGFTSIDPSIRVVNYSVFSHFRGQSKQRLSQKLIDIWQQNPDLPLLRLQAYGNDIGIRTNAWAAAGNIHFYFGKVEKEKYFQELAQGGIHLCTSQMEGFGHYLNEARAMSALTIALDAPPMNELITEEAGILVPAKELRKHGLGTLYFAEQQDLVQAIERARSMSVAERERLGRNARQLYEEQSKEFRESLYTYLQNVLGDMSSRTVKRPTVGAQPTAKENNDMQSHNVIFDNIYSKKLWGKLSERPEDPCSGLGSHDNKIVGPYVEVLSDFFGQFEDKLSVVDVGCGDFTVGGQVRHLFDTYIACDVSEVVLNSSKLRYSEFSVDFRHLDATSEELPIADVIVLRQVLQHLDNASIKRIVEKIVGKYKYAVITEHLPLSENFPRNMDKPTGSDIRLASGSGIVLSEAPFLLAFAKATELLSVPCFGGRVVTTIYEF